ncbi:MAG: glucose-6-phosphate dehydrogenase [Candidatus Eisenbacteria bacterium]|uniref:Glucose-6-phosphate 1-dehydrogenase n=2 Tax=Eiseniibacteriota bacterium TaxID=2212470 RepID=A0A538S677_UNCEI|nr:MAG: glucose-6-phosphate dehydrogenase [Candidatus Eisenbacteria bacterium]
MNARAVLATAPEIRANPLREESVTLKAADPCTFVVFGASGDLTHRKLIPALFRLSKQKLLHPQTAIVGFARREWTNEQFREEMKHAVESAGASPSEWERFAGALFYQSGVFEDHAAFRALGQLLSKVEEERGVPGNRIFHFATPPSEYATLVRNIGAAGLARRALRDDHAVPWSRVIIEKPFGRDLQSARDLNALVHTVFAERQVYRIDHYLGKETVQNILVFRLGNGIFEPLWNNRYVEQVQITVAESVGIEGRAAYFDTAGISRDIFQNHMMQLLTLTAMEPPARFEADSVRDEKAKVLRTLHPMTREEVARDTVRAQYAAGAAGGTPVPGYCEEPGVNPRSQTETYMAARIHVDNWRWSGVPFFLRAGKRLAKRSTEIAIVFRQPPFALFRSAGCETLEANVLRLRIQPDEGISLSFGSKSPGQALHIDPVQMDFYYLTAFGQDPPDAYERLLLDCNLGDSTLFARRDEVELAWEFVDGIQIAWRSGAPPLVKYAAGTWGPPQADELLAASGSRWYRL